MARKTDTVNRFEFVTVASARARQLLAGCTPKVDGADRLVKIAQREVHERMVEPLDTKTGE